MMISPEGFADRYESFDLNGLIDARNELIKKVQAYEKKYLSASRNKILEVLDEEFIMPSPQVMYQMNHLYLVEICNMIEVRHQEMVNADDEDFAGLTDAERLGLAMDADPNMGCNPRWIARHVRQYAEMESELDMLEQEEPDSEE